jgi:hypothetical protein
LLSPNQGQTLQASVGPCAAATSANLINGFVYKVDVTLPPALLPCGQDYIAAPAETFYPVTFSYNDAPVGPFFVPANLAGPVQNFSPPGTPMQMIIWATP